jgi:hypothetical protein
VDRVGRVESYKTSALFHALFTQVPRRGILRS